MNKLFDYSEQGLVKFAADFMGETELACKVGWGGPDSTRKKLEGVLQQCGNELRHSAPPDRRERVEVLLKGLSWDLEQELDRAVQRDEVVAKLSPLVGNAVRNAMSVLVR